MQAILLYGPSLVLTKMNEIIQKYNPETFTHITDQKIENV